MNRAKLGILIVIVGILTFAARGQTQSTQTVVIGFLTDTLTGRHGANALHTETAKRNVAAGMAQYAVYNVKTRKLYIIEPQDVAFAYLGQQVKVTGTLTPSPMNHAGQMVDPNTMQVKDFHTVGQDSSTPVAGILTISSITGALPPTTPKRVPTSLP
jgi:hypothetical protein